MEELYLETLQDILAIIERARKEDLSREDVLDLIEEKANLAVY